MIDWTYRVRDFILFSREIYGEMLIAYNEHLWPWQIVIFAVSLALIPMSRRFARMPSITLAVFWILVGYVFQQTHFQEINWAARYFAWAFYAEAVLIVYVGVVRNDFPLHGAGRLGTWIGRLLLAASLFIPWNLLVTPDLKTVQLFGWGADATALGTFGLVLLSGVRSRWMLALIPAAWISLAGLMYYGMK